jgi:hypothetical protein
MESDFNLIEQKASQEKDNYQKSTQCTKAQPGIQLRCAKHTIPHTFNAIG